MQDATFTFVRLRYRSGDWDTDQRMPANILNSLLEYTTIPINMTEKKSAPPIENAPAVV